MGIGLGMMAGVGGGIANMVGGVMNDSFNSVSHSPQTQAFCDNCGAKLAVGTMFCEECGTRLTPPDNVCNNCGYQFERIGKFCPKCGSKR
jgi:predicted amidophosphoribosyltransferase